MAGPPTLTGTLTRCTLLSLAPARAAASPDVELSSWLAPWAPPAGSGGGGGGVDPVGGGGTGGGGGGGGPLQERVVLIADEGCPGGRMGPGRQRGGVSLQHLGVSSYCFHSRSFKRMKGSLLIRDRQESVFLRKALQNLALLQSLPIPISQHRVLATLTYNRLTPLSPQSSSCSTHASPVCVGSS